jgi:hypothetical protein
MQEVILIGLSIICIIGAAVSEAIMDKLLFHYNRSIFITYKKQQWWNPKLSWKNKWKNGNKEEGERFMLSSTLLVGLTDAWHFFKSIMIVLLCIAIAVYVSYNQLFIYKLFEISVLGTVWNITFNITYNKIKI